MTKNRITFVQYSGNISGSGRSLELIVQAVQEAGWCVEVILGFDGPLRESFVDLGIRVRVCPHKNPFRSDRLPSSLRNAIAECQSGKQIAATLAASPPDLLYVNTGASYAGAYAAKQLGIPCIWHLRELFSDVGGELVVPRLMRGWAREQFLKLSDHLIANSRTVAQNLLGAAAGKAVVIPNAVEAAIFKPLDSGDPPAEFGLTTSEFVIGIPGTLRPMKGHRFALQALKPLLVQNQNLRVAITGDAKDAFGKSLMRDYAGDDWRKQNLWTGGLPNLRTFYAACDAVIVPSSSEPFGRTVIEAMAYGLPVVATRVGGIPEIIDDGVDGILVDYGDELGLREAVRNLLEDSQLRQKLGEAARAKVKREFSEKVHERRILDVVDQVIEKL